MTDRDPEAPLIDGVLETCLYADDLAAAAVFYRDVLGFELLSEKADRHLFFRCGAQMLLLFNPARSEQDGSKVPSHGARGPGHVAFAVPEDRLQQWRQHLSCHGVAVEQELQWPRGGHSIYFRDPAGNSLELAPATIWFGSRAPEREGES